MNNNYEDKTVQELDEILGELCKKKEEIFEEIDTVFAIVNKKRMGEVLDKLNVNPGDCIITKYCQYNHVKHKPISASICVQQVKKVESTFSGVSEGSALLNCKSVTFSMEYDDNDLPECKESRIVDEEFLRIDENSFEMSDKIAKFTIWMTADECKDVSLHQYGFTCHRTTIDDFIKAIQLHYEVQTNKAIFEATEFTKNQ